MSNTLDRLKALSDKLEVKLADRVEDTPQVETKVAKKAPKTTPKTVEAPKKISTNHEELAKKIINTMNIDAKAEKTRVENIHRVAELYQKLEIDEKAPDFELIFIYKAMNISGIGLKDDDFGEIREGKYCQIIAITYEPDKNGKKKAKNISLSYFGKAEKLEDGLKNNIMEFVLRWRYEKAFQNLEHYKFLLNKI